MPTFSIRALYQPTVLLAIVLLVIIVMMVLPVPSWVLDLGLTASFSFAILIFTITLFIEKPLDFSSFPSILLASLLLRLSLNVSSTKLIIGQGHTGPDAAGGVIEGFAMFIMGGDIFMGLIVFSVLVIVNFMVITKGAGRMAEVGARFALDAMPGKQLAIDSDVAAGSITHEEAKKLRELEQEETSFLGSLDGVSKFVKGDAVAGLLITLLNLIAGIAIGLTVHKISFAQAVENYSILTVGDGLVSQIPAVIISIASALLLSKGRDRGSVDMALVRQLGGHPAALATVSVMMLIFAAVPGLPMAPFAIGAAGLGFAAWRSWKQREAAEAAQRRASEEEKTAPPTEQTMGDILDLDDIHVEFAPDIIGLVMNSETGFDQRIERLRTYIAEEFGFILPKIRLSDSTLLPPQTYRVRLFGVEMARSVIKPSSVMALIGPDEHPHIPGENFNEPVYGAPARWVDAAYRDDLAIDGVVTIDPLEVIATNLMEVIQANFARLLTRRALNETLDALRRLSDPDRKSVTARILDEYIPDKVPPETLQAICRALLAERISIRNMPLILESIAEARSTLNTTEQITEYVRQRLGFQFLQKLKDDDGRIPILQLAPEWEATFASHESGAPGDPNTDVALPPTEFNRLASAVQSKVNDLASQGTLPAIATTTRRRRFLKTVLSAKGIRNPVISFDEMAPSDKPLIVGVVA